MCLFPEVAELTQAAPSMLHTRQGNTRQCKTIKGKTRLNSLPRTIPPNWLANLSRMIPRVALLRDCTLFANGNSRTDFTDGVANFVTHKKTSGPMLICESPSGGQSMCFWNFAIFHPPCVPSDGLVYSVFHVLFNPMRLLFFWVVLLAEGSAPCNFHTFFSRDVMHSPMHRRRPGKRPSYGKTLKSQIFVFSSDYR